MAIIGPDKKGRYAIRWRDARGGRHYETFKRGTPYEKVKRIHAQKLAERDKGVDSVATMDRILSDYIELHDVHAKRPFTDEGRERAESIVRMIVGDKKKDVARDPLADLVAADLKPKDVLQWRLRRKKAGASDATLDREYNLLRSALNLAVATGELDRFPVARGVVKRLVPVAEGKVEFFQPEEWRTFIAALDDEGRWQKHVETTRRFGPTKIGATIDTPRRYGAGRKPDSDATRQYRLRLLEFRPIFIALLWSGSRLSEIRLLTWDCVDFRSGYVTVPMGKSGHTKTVPLAEEWRADLESRPRGIGKAPVYPSADGAVYSKVAVQRAFRVYRDLAGLRSTLTPHAIRHTVASWMGIAGRSPNEIKEFLGHRSLVMTMKYIHRAPSHLLGALKAMQEMAVSTTTREKNVDPAKETIKATD